MLCFGGSGWDTREQGDVRGSSISQVISPLEGQGRAWEGKQRDLPPWADIFPSYFLEHKLSQDGSRGKHPHAQEQGGLPCGHLLQGFCLLGLVCTQHGPQTFLLAIFVPPLLLLQFSGILPAFTKGEGQQNETRSWGRG